MERSVRLKLIPCYQVRGGVLLRSWGWLRFGFSLGLGVFLGLGGGCARRPAVVVQPSPTADTQVFENITLDQSDEQGNRLWKVKADQARYNRDRKVAQIVQPRGQFFEAKQAVYEVSADRGEAREDGQRMILRGRVEVRDLRDGAVVKAEEAEWQPKEKVLWVRRQIQGAREDLQLMADEGRWQSDTNSLTLTGAPLVLTAGKQGLKLQTTQATWQIRSETIQSDRPVTIERFTLTTPPQLTSKAQGQTLLVNLKSQSVTLRNQAQVNFIEPPLDITSNVIRWEVAQEKVFSDVAIAILDRKEQIKITAQRGQADLKRQVVSLTGQVDGKSQRPPAQLQADQLRWSIPSQQVEAEGNVRYIRTEPPLDVSGPRATGNLRDETVTVSGGRSTTIIVP